MNEAIPAAAREAMADPERAFGKYRLVSVIAEGGMGEVWKAWDSELSRWVALKFLVPGSSDEDLERFRREALADAKLSHPNIAAVYDAGEVAGRRFIAMQFIDGRPLSKTHLPLPRALEVMRDAANAIHFAHQRGVIHRDIKPSNLLLDASGRVFVIDFGIARTSESSGTLSKDDELLGTPPFMSPEQAAGLKAPDPRADVYGLGATLYALVTGRNPFLGEVSSDMLLRVIHQDPPTPRRVRPEVPREVETIILKAMEKDPRRRYSSAALLADDLRRYLDGEPILAHPPSFLYRLGKRLAKRKAVIGAVLAGLGAVAVTLAILVPRWREERDRAEKERSAKVEAQRNQEAMQELNRLWAHAVTVKEWTRQGFRKPADIRAEFGKAEKDLTAFILRHREMPQGWYVRARVRLNLCDPAGAEADLREATRLRPDFAPGWTLLAQVFIERYQEERMSEGDEASGQPLALADDAVRKSSSADPSPSRWGLSATREDDVIRTVTAALKKRYLEPRDAEGAYDLLRQALDRDPSEEYCRWMALWTPGGKERFALLDRAIAIAPRYAFPYYMRGRCLDRDYGKLTEAIEDYSRAIEIHPRFLQAWCNRGCLRQKQGDFESSADDHTKAIEIDPRSLEPYLGRAMARLSKGDRAGAADDLRKVLDLAPPDWPYRETITRRLDDIGVR